MGRSSVFSLEQIYRKQVVGTWSKIPEVFRYVNSLTSGTPNYGYFGAGAYNPRTIVDRVDFDNDTATATPKGNLSSARYKCAGIGNKDYGYFGGGVTTSPSYDTSITTVDRLDYSNDSADMVEKGPLANHHRANDNTVGNNNYGYWCGSVGRSWVDRIDYSSDTSTTVEKGSLSIKRAGAMGAGDASYGYICGGETPSRVSSIDRIDFSSDTSTAAPKGNLTNTVDNGAATGNASYGYIGGGSTPSPVSTVDRIDYSNDTATASPKGPLVRTNWLFSATGNTSYGYFGGGDPPSSPSPYGSSFVDRVDYSNDTPTMSSKGNLSVAYRNTNSFSPREYALPFDLGIAPATRTEAYPRSAGLDFGYVGMGYGGSRLSTVNRIDFSNDTSAASVKGSLTVARNTGSGVSGESYGYFAGGYSGGSSETGDRSIVDRVDYANDTPTASITGNLSDGRAGGGPVGNVNYGYIAGGRTASTADVNSKIDRIDYSNDSATASPKGNIPDGGWFYQGSTGNQSYGYLGGRRFPAPSGYSYITRIDFANDTATTSPKGNLGSPKYETAATGNVDFGYWSGGNESSVIDRLDFSNDTANTVEKGNISSTPASDIGRYGAGAFSSSSHGYFAGGRYPATYFSTVDRIDYSNDTATAAVKGSLSYSANSVVGLSPTPVPSTVSQTVDKGADGYVVAGALGPAFGYFGGGTKPPAYSTVDRVDFANDTATASTKGSLNVNRYGHAATSNTSYGWFGGGGGPAAERGSVDRVDFANDTATASVRGGFSVPKYGSGAAGNTSYGYFAGGYSPSTVSTIDRIDYANDSATATPKGSLSAAAVYNTAAGNLSYGYFNVGIPAVDSSNIERIDYGNDTAVASPKGSLSTSRYWNAATGNASYGYWGGNAPYAGKTIVDRIDYANDTATASPKGLLATPQALNAATGSSAFGYFGGGSGGPSGTDISNVDRIDYSNDTATASPKGPLSQVKSSLAATGAQDEGMQGSPSFIPRIRWVDSASEGTPVTQGPAFGYWLGSYGYTSVVDRIDFSNDTANAVHTADSTWQAQGLAGTSSITHGYWAGGWEGSATTTGNRIDYSSDTGTLAVKGTLSVDRRWHMAVGNASAGYQAGGFPSTSSIDKIDYSNDTTASAPGANLATIRNGSAGAGNKSYGYFAGGNPGPVSIVERLDYSSDTSNTSPKGTLTATSYYKAGASNSDYGWYSGGSEPEISSVDRIDFSNDTATATPKGPLSHTRRAHGATGSSSYGYFGGNESPTGGTSIDRIDYSNDTATATPKGNFSVTWRKGSGGVSAQENANPTPQPTIAAPVQPPFPYPQQLPGPAINVNGVFDAFLYTGNGLATSSNRAIDVGIDFATNGGMVWIKNRSEVEDHVMQDTVRGAGSTKRLASNSDNAANSGVNASTGGHISSFTSTGFELNNGSSTSNLEVNSNADNFVAWCFRKAAGFFDIQTWTGNGTAGRTISHNLDSVPGAIWIKNVNDNGDWICYHRQTDDTAPENFYLKLNATSDKTDDTMFYDTAPTSTQFTLGSNNDVNKNGDTYVAYIFAHNDARFGANYDKAIIYCGGYIGSSAPNTVTIGWKPQFLIFKNPSNASMNWRMYDDARGIPTGVEPRLMPNLTNAEETIYDKVDVTSTGFVLNLDNNDMNQNGVLHTYIAIRILD